MLIICVGGQALVCKRRHTFGAGGRRFSAACFAGNGAALSHCMAANVRYFRDWRRRDPKRFLAPQTVVDDCYTPVDTLFFSVVFDRDIK